MDIDSDSPVLVESQASQLLAFHEFQPVPSNVSTVNPSMSFPSQSSHHVIITNERSCYESFSISISVTASISASTYTASASISISASVTTSNGRYICNDRCDADVNGPDGTVSSCPFSAVTFIAFIYVTSRLRLSIVDS
jgi:hypothetical protein